MSNGSFETSFTLSLHDVSYDGFADTVSLYASPGSQVFVFAEAEDYSQRQGTVNTDGSCTADFSETGPGGMGQATIDIGYGTDVYISVGTIGGNQENYYLPGPLGRIILLMDTNRVRARDWLIGGTIALTADDPATPASPDFSGSNRRRATASIFDLTGYLKLKPGLAST